MNSTKLASAKCLWALPGASLSNITDVVAQDGKLVDLASTNVIMPCPSFLIEHDRGLVLFDTGVSPRGLANPEEYFPHLAERFQLERRPDLGVDYQIRGLGLRLEDVKYVVPSHLHFDHAGGLYLFPGSTFIVGEGEIEHAYMNSSGPYFLLDDISPTRSFRWIEIGGDLDLFGDGSVSILFSPGHTPGSLALFVRLPDRNFILSGDSCHYPAEVQLGAARSPGADAPRATRSLQRLILLRDTWDAYFWIGHDMGQWQEWPHAPASI